jgi:hypothetical protein
MDEPGCLADVATTATGRRRTAMRRGTARRYHPHPHWPPCTLHGWALQTNRGEA